MFKSAIEHLTQSKASAGVWRARLGEIADEHKGAASGAPKSANAAVVGAPQEVLGGDGSFLDSAARAVAAVHQAMGAPRPHSKAKRPVDKKLCLWKLVHG